MKKRFVILIVFLAGVLAYLLSLLSPVVEQYLTEPGIVGYTVYFLLIVTEVVVAPIPGGVLALLGAANLGFWPAWILNYLANVVGASIAFLLARKFGKPFVDRVVKKEAQKRYNAIVEGHFAFAYLAYAFPFFPIDILSFLFGLSKISYRKFVTMAALALPINSGAYAYLGSRFGTQVPYLQEISMIVFVVIITAAAIWIYSETSRQ